jgi:hypothetical protein
LNAIGVRRDLDDVRPAGRGAGGIRPEIERAEFALFPVSQRPFKQIVPVAKMPVKAALTDAKLSRENFHANGLDAKFRELVESCLNPIAWLKGRSLREFGGARHTLPYVGDDRS